MHAGGGRGACRADGRATRSVRWPARRCGQGFARLGRRVGRREHENVEGSRPERTGPEPGGHSPTPHSAPRAPCFHLSQGNRPSALGQRRSLAGARAPLKAIRAIPRHGPTPAIASRPRRTRVWEVAHHLVEKPLLRLRQQTSALATAAALGRACGDGQPEQMACGAREHPVAGYGCPRLLATHR